MKLISMADDKKSFQICAISGTKKFNIVEMLFLNRENIPIIQDASILM